MEANYLRDASSPIIVEGPRDWHWSRVQAAVEELSAQGALAGNSENTVLAAAQHAGTVHCPYLSFTSCLITLC